MAFVVGVLWLKITESHKSSKETEKDNVQDIP